MSKDAQKPKDLTLSAPEAIDDLLQGEPSPGWSKQKKIRMAVMAGLVILMLCAAAFVLGHVAGTKRAELKHEYDRALTKYRDEMMDLKHAAESHDEQGYRHALRYAKSAYANLQDLGELKLRDGFLQARYNQALNNHQYICELIEMVYERGRLPSGNLSTEAIHALTKIVGLLGPSYFYGD